MSKNRIQICIEKRYLSAWMELTRADWDELKRLRNHFLFEGKLSDYWSPRSLELYDEFFARRIAWKWDSVLGELRALGWQPPPKGELVDFGCGTAMATRRYMEWMGRPDRINLLDRSKLAVSFAEKKLSPLPVVQGEPSADYVLLVSHVINELPPADKDHLRRLMERAHTVIWVEPGTAESSRAIIEMREKLRTGFSVWAPCLHQNRCGIAEDDWCHFFAEPAPEVFTERRWKLFSQELNIDLRALPTSYLVLSQLPTSERRANHRVIGRARTYKGYAKALGCSSDGVCEKQLKTRDHGDLVRELKAGKFRSVF